MARLETPDFPAALRDRYQPQQVLGKGGMGAVYRAHDPSGRAVAVKLMLDVTDGAARARFVREARGLEALDHPHVLRHVESGEVEGVPYLVTELVEGDSLDQAYRDLDDPVAPMLQVADALEYLHAQDLLHRDIKPANILLAPDGRAVLADFGLVYRQDLEGLTATGVVVGTPAYLSPEALTMGQKSPATDWWAWGACLYVLLEHGAPYSLSEIGATLQDVPLPPLKFFRVDRAGGEAAMIRACLDPDPDRRPSSRAELEDLRANPTLRPPAEAEGAASQLGRELRRVRTLSGETAVMGHEDAATRPLEVEAPGPATPKALRPAWLAFGLLFVLGALWPVVAPGGPQHPARVAVGATRVSGADRLDLDGEVLALAGRPDGEVLALDATGAPWLWDPATELAEALATLPLHPRRARLTSSLAVLANDDGAVAVVDPEDPEPRPWPPHSEAAVASLAVADPPHVGALGLDSGEVLAWTVATGSPLARHRFDQGPAAVGLAPDGGTLVAAAGGEVVALDLAEAPGASLWAGPLEHTPPLHLVVAPEGRRAFAGDAAGRIWVLDGDAQTVHRVRGPGGPAILAARLLPGADVALVGDDRGQVQAWGLISRELLWDRPASTAPVQALAVTGDQVLAGDLAGGIRRLDLEDLPQRARQQAAPPDPEALPLRSLARAPRVRTRFTPEGFAAGAGPAVGLDEAGLSEAGRRFAEGLEIGGRKVGATDAPARRPSAKRCRALFTQDPDTAAAAGCRDAATCAALKAEDRARAWSLGCP